MTTLLHTLSEALGTNEYVEKARNQKRVLDAKQKINYDKHAKDLRPLLPGTPVWIQNLDSGIWDQRGVISNHTRGRTYKIQLDSGQVLYRNRIKVRKRVTD